MKESLRRFIDNPNLICDSLEKAKSYRPYDPGWYLYRIVASKPNVLEKFSDEFIELVYTTLIAWNMNARGAELATFDTFRGSILENKARLVALSDYRIEDLSEESLRGILVEARKLYSKLKLVARAKRKLATNSKALHFFIPTLFIPIDNSYTLKYFHKNNPAGVKDQFDLLSQILEEARKLAASSRLERFIDHNRNLNIPKIIDNILIGYKGRNLQ